MSLTQTQTQPWTADLFGPGELYDTSDEGRTLQPYHTRIGERVYDQRAFTADRNHRFQAFIGGVGSGKTVAGIMRMAAHVAEWNAGSLGAIITPTSLGIKNTILPKLHEWGFMDTWEYRGPQSEAPGLHAPNDTRILLESANNQRRIHRLRGYDLAWWWIDEPRNVPELAFEVLRGRLRAGEYRNGFFTSTPAGLSNWLYHRLHPEGDRTLDDLQALLGVPTYANPHLADDYKQDLVAGYSGQFKAQEVEAAFIEPEGLVYDWFDRDDHVLDVRRDSDAIPESYDRFIYGVDWGFHPHPAAMLAIGERDGDYYILQEHYERRNTDEDLAAILVDWYDEFGRGPVYCDPSEPDSIHKLTQEGLRAKKADNSVDSGIKHVTSLQDRLHIVSTCQNLINEFGQYQYDDNGDPVKEMDHAADSLRYALHTDRDAGESFMVM